MRPRRQKRSRHLLRSRFYETVPTLPNEKRFQTRLFSRLSPFHFPTTVHLGCASSPPCTPRPTIARCRSLNDALNAPRRARDVRRRGRRVARVAKPRRRDRTLADGTPAPRAYRPRVSESSEERSNPTARTGGSRPPKPPRAASRRPREAARAPGTRPARNALRPPPTPPTPPTPTPRWTSRESPWKPPPASRRRRLSSRARARHAPRHAPPPAHPGNVRVVERRAESPARALSTAKTAATPTRTRAREVRLDTVALGRRHVGIVRVDAEGYRRRFRRGGCHSARARPGGDKRVAVRGAPLHAGKAPVLRAARRARAQRARDGLVPALDALRAETTARLLERAFASRPPRRRAARRASRAPTRAAARPRKRSPYRPHPRRLRAPSPARP